MSLVGKERLELSQYCYHWILSPTRLPVPPFALFAANLTLIQTLCFYFNLEATKILFISIPD